MASDYDFNFNTQYIFHDASCLHYLHNKQINQIKYSRKELHT